MTFYWRWWQKRCKNKIWWQKKFNKNWSRRWLETIPYLSPKNGIKKDDDADTILYASKYNSPKHEIDEKIYVEPKLETIKETGEKTVQKEDDFIKSVIDENKVGIQISRDAEIKIIQDVFDEVKDEPKMVKPDAFFYWWHGYFQRRKRVTKR